MKVTLVLLRTDAEFRCNFWAAKKCQRIGLCLVPFWQGAQEHDSLLFSFAENLHRKPLRKLKLFFLFPCASLPSTELKKAHFSSLCAKIDGQFWPSAFGCHDGAPFLFDCLVHF